MYNVHDFWYVRGKRTGMLEISHEKHIYNNAQRQ